MSYGIYLNCWQALEKVFFQKQSVNHSLAFTKTFYGPGFQGSGFLGSQVFKVRVQILKVAVSHFTLVGFFQ